MIDQGATTWKSVKWVTGGGHLWDTSYLSITLVQYTQQWHQLMDVKLHVKGELRCYLGSLLLLWTFLSRLLNLFSKNVYKFTCKKIRHFSNWIVNSERRRVGSCTPMGSGCVRPEVIRRLERSVASSAAATFHKPRAVVHQHFLRRATSA